MYQFNGDLNQGKNLYVYFLCFSVESTDPEERSQQQREWLKSNTEPYSMVQEYMKATALYRAKWIRADGTKDMRMVINEYPHLTDPRMVWVLLHTMTVHYISAITMAASYHMVCFFVLFFPVFSRYHRTSWCCTGKLHQSFLKRGCPCMRRRFFIWLRKRANSPHFPA